MIGKYTKHVATMALLATFVISGRTYAFQDDENLRSPVLEMEVFQDGDNVEFESATISTDDRRVIKLAKEPFLLSLPKHSDKDVFQVCIWTDDSIFKKARLGLSTQDVSFYSPGSGIAAARSAYSTIYIDDIAHNYLYDERLVSLATNRHGISISRLGLVGKEYSVAELGQSLYFVIFADWNKNKVIDEGELEYFVFEF